MSWGSTAPSNISQPESFMKDPDIQTVHVMFAVVTIIYIPFILVNNSLVLGSTVLFHKLHNPNNIILASLAVADLIMGLYCIPMYALSYIPATEYLVKSSGKFACLAWFASIELGGAASLKNLILTTVDRFIAVTYPLSYHKIVTLQRTAIALAAMWLYVIAMSFVPFMGWNNYNPSVQDPGRRCNFYITLKPAYVIWASFFTVAISIVIPLLLNIKIFYVVHRQQRSLRTFDHLWSSKQVKRFRERVQTVRITGVLCVLFIVFWLPYVLVAPLKYTEMSPKDIEIVKVIVQLFYFLNSVVNAPIYAWMRTEYRVAYCLMLRTPVWRWGSLRRHSLQAPPTDSRHKESCVFVSEGNKTNTTTTSVARNTVLNSVEDNVAITSTQPGDAEHSTTELPIISHLCRSAWPKDCDTTATSMASDFGTGDKLKFGEQPAVVETQEQDCCQDLTIRPPWSKGPYETRKSQKCHLKFSGGKISPSDNRESLSQDVARMKPYLGNTSVVHDTTQPKVQGAASAPTSQRSQHLNNVARIYPMEAWSGQDGGKKLEAYTVKCNQGRV